MEILFLRVIFLKLKFWSLKVIFSDKLKKTVKKAGFKDIVVSISHNKEYAVANAMGVL